jgi:thioredoxin 1
MTRPAMTLATFSKSLVLAWAVAALTVPGCSSAGSKTVTLTTSNFEEKVFNNKGPVLVDFWADRCPPCRTMDPVIRELASELEGKVLVGKVNIEEHPEIAAKYGIGAIPTFLVFKDGDLKRRLQGVQDKQYLRDILGAMQ